MKTVTVEQIQELDRVAIQERGIPSLQLMEAAGKACFEVIRKKSPKRVTVICGIGNNAGDGFVIARHLINAGVNLDLFVTGPTKRLKNDALVNCRILRKLKYPVHQILKIDSNFEKCLKKADCVVDAIFGVGLNREINDPFRSVIHAVNRFGKKIVSVDIPSGLDGTTGKTWGACIDASATVTFSFAKKGFYLKEGPQHVGKIIVVDIGIPEKLKRRILRT